MNDYQSSQWDLIAPSVEFTSAIDLDGICSRLGPRDRILDYGCGYGRLSRILVDSGFDNVVGYDTSAAMITRGRRQYPDLNLGLSNALEIDDADSRYDAVVIAGLLTSIPNGLIRTRVIAELSRVLVPGGLLFLSEFVQDPERSYDSNGCFLSSLGVQMKHFHVTELTHMLQRWEVLEMTERPFKSVGALLVPGVQAIARTLT